MFAVLAHVLATMAALFLLGNVDDGKLAQDVCGEGLVLDVDVEAGEAGGEAGVLTLLADGERELVVGNDDRGVAGLGVDDDAGDLGGRQGVGDELARILIPEDDVDALAAQLGHDGAHAAALGADAGAHGVEAVIERGDGDLGADAGVAGDRVDLDAALVDLGHLLLEEAREELGARAAHDDRRARTVAADGSGVAIGVADVDDDRLDALVVGVALAGRALVALVLVAALVEVRKLGLDALADLEDRELVGDLEHRAGDHVAETVGELLVDLGARSVADEVVDLGLGVLGCDAARVGGRDVEFVVSGVGVELLVVGVLLRDELVDVDLAGLARDGDAGLLARLGVDVEHVLVALGERLLETVEQDELIDVLLLAKLRQGLDHFRCHGNSVPFYSCFPDAPEKSYTGLMVQLLMSARSKEKASPSQVTVTAVPSMPSSVPVNLRRPS